MSDKLLDHPECNYALKTSLKAAIYLNPLLQVVHMVLDAMNKRPLTLSLMCLVSLSITVLVSVSGSYFRRHVGKYMGGGFVGRVDSRY